MSEATPPSKAEGRPFRMADVRALARIAVQFDLAEVEFSRDGERIVVRRGPAFQQAQQAAAPAPAGEEPAPPRPADGGGGAPAEDGAVTITSPFVGTFYRAPSPGADPFVVEGQAVKKGEVLCIVEAMKLMNEIEAETDCRVLEILVSDAEPVEFGQPLFKVLPL